MAAESRAAAAVLLLSGAAVVLLSQQVLQDLPPDQRATALALLVPGLLLFLAGVLLARGGLPPRLSRLLDGLSARLGLQSWQVFLLLPGLFCAAAVPLAAGQGWKMTSPLAAMSAWTAGILLISAAVWRKEAVLRPRPGVLLMALMLGVGAFLARGLATDQVPIFLTGDEGSAGLAGLHFKSGRMDNPFISSWYSFPSLYFLIPSLSITAFGQTAEALRLPSALAGALTVTCVYLVGRAMFGARAGFFAALFLGAFHFHVHFSRIGLNNVWDGLWYTVVAGALWYGWEQERRNAFLLAGLALGLSQYFYPSGRTLVLLVLLWLALAGLFDRGRLRRNLAGLLWMAAAALVVVLPLAWYYLQHPDEYMAPLVRVSIFRGILEDEMHSSGQPAWMVLLRQAAGGFAAYTYTPLRAWYQPETPLLRPLPAGFFLLGVILLVLRARGTSAWLLGLWLIAFGLLGGLSESTPAAQRYVAAAPACALVLAYGLDETARLLAGLGPRLARLGAMLAVLLALGMAADDLRFYFHEYTPRSAVVLARSNTMVAQRLADYLQSQPTDREVVFFGQPFMGFRSIPSLQYLAPHIQGIDIPYRWGAVDNPRPSAERLIFVFLSSHEEQVPLVQQDYPGGRLEMVLAADGQVLYWLYEYPGSP
jgi:hypothetical protein